MAALVSALAPEATSEGQMVKAMVAPSAIIMAIGGAAKGWGW